MGCSGQGFRPAAAVGRSPAPDFHSQDCCPAVKGPDGSSPVLQCASSCGTSPCRLHPLPHRAVHFLSLSLRGIHVTLHRRRPHGATRYSESCPPLPPSLLSYLCYTPTPSPPAVQSLDQLYTQAACLQPILCARVRQWALASGGLVETLVEKTSSDHCLTQHVRVSERFLALSSVIGTSKEGLVRWPLLKSVERAIKKSQRSHYGVSGLGFV